MKKKGTKLRQKLKQRRNLPDEIRIFTHSAHLEAILNTIKSNNKPRNNNVERLVEGGTLFRKCQKYIHIADKNRL